VTIPLPDDAVIHRLGGADVVNLRLKPAEMTLTPPGFSTLVGGTPKQAADAMRAVFPRAKKWQGSIEVGSATVAAIRATGFDVVPDPTPNFPNHVRLIHPGGATEFTDVNLKRLAIAFTTSTGH